MDVHSHSVNAQIYKYILEKNHTERNHENCIINVWLHIYCIMMVMYYRTPSELLLKLGLILNSTN